MPTETFRPGKVIYKKKRKAPFLRLVPSYVDLDISNVKDRMFNGKLVKELTKEEAIESVTYLLQIIDIMFEKHKQSMLELIGVRK